MNREKWRCLVEFLPLGNALLMGKFSPPSRASRHSDTDGDVNKKFALEEGVLAGVLGMVGFADRFAQILKEKL